MGIMWVTHWQSTQAVRAFVLAPGMIHALLAAKPYLRSAGCPDGDACFSGVVPDLVAIPLPDTVMECGILFRKLGSYRRVTERGRSERALKPSVSSLPPISSVLFSLR